MNNYKLGDAHVGKSALTSMFHTGGSSYPKNYVMVRNPIYLHQIGLNLPPNIILTINCCINIFLFKHRQLGWIFV